MKTFIGLQNKNEYMEVTCDIRYDIDPGQKGIYNSPMDKCQQYYPPEVEEIELISATIEYNTLIWPITQESVWWEILEERLNESDRVKDLCLEDAYDEENNWC